jgi:hypothetical protein
MPNDVMLMTMAQKFKPCRAVNQTSGSYVAKVPQVGAPTLSSLWGGSTADTATSQACQLLANEGGSASQNGVKIAFYGTGTNGQTFNCKVYGWTPVLLQNQPLQETWISILMCELQATLDSNLPGVDAVITSGMLFASQITIVTGNANVSVEVVTNSSDDVAHAMVDMKGARRMELTFKVGTATDANALVALL